MKGYKGMDKNMRCREMQYEVGKSYHVDGEIRVCRNGLHFCEQLSNVFYYYERNNGNRFFEVEASGAIMFGRNKNAASDLVIIRELSDIEINRAVYLTCNDYDYCYGNGYGNGNNCFGDGWGNGYDYGYGYNNGSGEGDGYGDGNGHSYCNGYNNGSGEGYGNGYGEGYGDGYDGHGLNKILLFA